MSERMQKGKTKGQQIEYLKIKLSEKNTQLKAVKKFLSNAKEALVLIDKYNPLRHDLDAYLLDVNEWGQGKGPKPNPKDFGIDE